MKEIPLTRHLVTLVDDEDFDQFGSLKWYASSHGIKTYATRSDYSTGKHKRIYLHRLIAEAMGAEQVDHIDGDGLNNLRANLRASTVTQNNQNRGRTNKPTTSKFKGVYWHKDSERWAVEITAFGVRHRLGYFTDEMEAALSYDAAAKSLHGRYARTNRDLGLL